jgi:hypothetical protein
MTTREQFALAIYCATLQSPLAAQIIAESAVTKRSFSDLAQAGADDLLATLAKTAPKTDGLPK